ncbi:hypothetical protein NHX12_033476 [Muraenolepis orangiensis]|uniref:Uncharacterized protein n=1 Tax=Muraenolepis orangiensis TaxID=630683 RepID=A0A9Q0IGB7_9TELE|nr:hypothetical protein NHX12_033476 [Muraenolepis orangiensis]
MTYPRRRIAAISGRISVTFWPSGGPYSGDWPESPPIAIGAPIMTVITRNMMTEDVSHRVVMMSLEDNKARGGGVGGVGGGKRERVEADVRFLTPHIWEAAVAVRRADLDQGGPRLDQ